MRRREEHFPEGIMDCFIRIMIFVPVLVVVLCGGVAAFDKEGQHYSLIFDTPHTTDMFIKIY